MVICAKCGKKINRFFSIKSIKWHWIKEYENSNKKNYYCPECFEKIWRCAKCGKNLESFKDKEVGYVIDKNGKSTYYCPKCFENEEKRIEREEKKVKQKKEQEKKKAEIKKEEKTQKFKTDLMNDELISRFSEKYFQVCLSLKPLRNFEILRTIRKLFEEEDEKEYQYILDSILSENIYKFKNIFSTEKVSFYTERNKIATENKIIKDITNLDDIIDYDEYPDKVRKYTYSLENDFLYFDDSIKEAFLNFLEIIYKKYENLTTTLLIEILDSKAREYLLQDSMKDCNKLKTEEDLFKYLEEMGFASFVEGKKIRFFGKEYLKIFLDCAKTKKLTNCKSLDELREKAKEFQKNIKLKDFENKLLKPSTNTISIEDIDVMSGFEFEDFLSKLFKNIGYKVVQTKLSGDQGADLIIERNNKKTVVQAKCYSGKLSNKAIQEVVASIKHYKADVGMVVTNSHFTPSAVKLADSNDIRLIDRTKLKELIEKYIS